MKRLVIWFFGLVIVGFFLAAVAAILQRIDTPDTSTDSVTRRVTYFCDGGVIDASYAVGSVTLQLSDGRKVVLPFASSTGQYEGQGIVFDDAYLLEGDMMTHKACIAGVASGSLGMTTFSDQEKSFELTVPEAFMISGDEGVAPKADMRMMSMAASTEKSLVKVTVPPTYQPHTNFMNAVFTAKVREGAACDTTGTNVQFNGRTWKKTITSDAGAGNFYETTTYQAPYRDDCYVLAYTIHSTNLGNYPAEEGRKQYNKTEVVQTLENMVKSFKVIPTLDEEAELKVRELVHNFGEKLKFVPLTASAEILKESMNQNYAPYVAQPLIDTWIANPIIAVGRRTSSPAPDRIVIDSLKKVSNTMYIVNGTVIETVQTTDVSTSSISITIERIDGIFKITNAF